jgi:hypothetical protein
MDLADRVKKELTEILARYAAGNAEIVRTYFSRPRSKEQDVSWLKCQIARELTTAWKFLDNLNDLKPRFEKSLKRSDYENLAHAFVEELEHYRLFVAVLEEELNTKIDVDELLTLGVWSENDSFPENTKKANFEKQLRASGNDMAKIALGIGEGGGSGWLIGLSRISGGKLEQRMAKVAKEIADDEMFHGPIHIAAAARRIQTDEQLEEAKQILTRYLHRHLRMKNEQFGYPLTNERLVEIDNGKVEPLEGVDFSPIARDREDLAAYAL